MTLKPCPFCGGEAEMDWHQPFRHYRTGQPLDQPAVYCTECTAQIAHYPGDLGLCRDETGELVVAAWNTRASTAPDAEPVAQAVEALREALRQIEKYAEFFCEEDFDPTVDSLRAALAAMGERS